jgi:predicted HAD superfamily hydrolase
MNRSKREDMPERHGKIWETKEEEFVLDKVKNKVPVYMIANDVKRTPNGVYSHLKTIACKYIDDGMLIEEASNLTGVTIPEIKELQIKQDIAKKTKEQKGLTFKEPIKEEDLSYDERVLKEALHRIKIENFERAVRIKILELRNKQKTI